MKVKVAFSILLLAIFGIVALPRTAQAQDDHAVVMRFDKPIEIPGRVLPAGTYTFVAPEDQEGDVIQIFNGARTHMIATVQAIRTERVDPTDKFQVILGESSQSGSQALIKWFDAGATSGYELLYPHREEQRLRASETAVSTQPLERPVSGD
jgi:hypothetical protein